MIGCKKCSFTCDDYVRNSQGQQRSGYRLLAAHYEREHDTLPRHKGRFWEGNTTLPSTVDDRCFTCSGAGCESCEPLGRAAVQTWNFNTLEQIS